MNNDPLINLNRLRNATTEAERIEIRSILSVEERKVLEEQRKERRQHKRKNSLEENQTTSKKQKGDYKRCPFCDEEMVNNVSYMMFHVANCLQLEKKKNNKENVDPQKEWPLTEGRDYMNPKRDKDKEKKDRVSVYTKLSNSETMFSSLIGLSIESFNQLHSLIKDELESTVLSSPNKEKTGPGTKRKLSSYDQLLLLLLFLRQYPIESLLAFIFDISQSSVSFYINHSLDILHSHMSKKIIWPSYESRNEKAVCLSGAKVTIIIDGSEQQICTFSNKQLEQFFYSAKKSKHTLTVLLACSPTGIIYFLSKSYPGSRSDLTLYNLHENSLHLKMEESEYICGDPGFIGLQKIHPLIVPFERSVINDPSISPELKDSRAKFSNHVSRYRTVVENVFAHIKKWKACSDRFRYHDNPDLMMEKHNKIWRTCAGLMNTFISPLRTY